MQAWVQRAGRYVFFSLLLSAAGCDFQRYFMFRAYCSATRVDSFAVDSVAGRSVRIATSNGAVTVETSDGDTLAAQATVTAYAATKEAAEQRLSRLVPRLKETEKEIVLQAPEPDRTSYGDGVAFVVQVPADTPVIARSSNGTVKVTGTRASVTVETSNGTVHVEDARGEVRAKTSNGLLQITNLDGTVSAATSNGEVHFTGILHGSGNKLHTSNGPIRVGLPADLATRVIASTSNGSIQCSLPLTSAGLAGGDNQLEGVVGDAAAEAGAELQIRTTNGRIRIESWHEPAETFRVELEQPEL